MKIILYKIILVLKYMNLKKIKKLAPYVFAGLSMLTPNENVKAYDHNNSINNAQKKTQTRMVNILPKETQDYNGENTQILENIQNKISDGVNRLNNPINNLVDYISNIEINDSDWLNMGPEEHQNFLIKLLSGKIATQISVANNFNPQQMDIVKKGIKNTLSDLYTFLQKTENLNKNLDDLLLDFINQENLVSKFNLSLEDLHAVLSTVVLKMTSLTISGKEDYNKYREQFWHNANHDIHLYFEGGIPRNAGETGVKSCDDLWINKDVDGRENIKGVIENARKLCEDLGVKKYNELVKEIKPAVKSPQQLAGDIANTLRTLGLKSLSLDEFSSKHEIEKIITIIDKMLSDNGDNYINVVVKKLSEEMSIIFSPAQMSNRSENINNFFSYWVVKLNEKLDSEILKKLNNNIPLNNNDKIAIANLIKSLGGANSKISDDNIVSIVKYIYEVDYYAKQYRKIHLKGSNLSSLNTISLHLQRYLSNSDRLELTKALGLLDALIKKMP